VNGTYYLFYDGAGKDGWRSCLAESKDLKHWVKKGAILKLAKPGSNDAKSASSPWIIKEGKTWHMFYLGTPHTSPPPIIRQSYRLKNITDTAEATKALDSLDQRINIFHQYSE